MSTERVRASATIHKGQAIAIDTTANGSRQYPVGRVADTATDDVIGVARSRIASGQSRRVATIGRAVVLVDVGETVARGDSVTEAATLGRFGKAGDIVFGTYLGAKDDAGLAPVWLDDLASIGQGPGGGSGLPDEVYMDEYGNIIEGADNITRWLASPSTVWSGNHIGAGVTFTPPDAGVLMIGCTFLGGPEDVVVDLSGLTAATVIDGDGHITAGSSLRGLTMDVGPCESGGLFTMVDGDGVVTIEDARVPRYAVLDASDFNVTMRRARSTRTLTLTATTGDIRVEDAEAIGGFILDDQSTIQRVKFSGGGISGSGGIYDSQITLDGQLTLAPGKVVYGCLIVGGNTSILHDCEKVTIFDVGFTFTTSGANVGTYRGFGLDTLVD